MRSIHRRRAAWVTIAPLAVAAADARTTHAQPPQPAPLPVLTAVRLDPLPAGNGWSVQVTARGTPPTAVRVSLRPDVADAAWQPWRPPITLLPAQVNASPLPRCPDGPGRLLAVYVQVRAAVGTTLVIRDGQRLVEPALVASNVVRAARCIDD
jgi:hypothetical protein